MAERFRMYKIRTMRRDAEAHTGPVWTKTKDPRITRIGRILRKLHLDELPQLLNVMRGEMSLVGPRPERPEFVEVLAEEIPGYMDRVLVCPGVTGLAQVNLPPDTDLKSVRRKLLLDRQYVAEAGLLLDVRLFLCTLGRMCKIPLVRAWGYAARRRSRNRRRERFNSSAKKARRPGRGKACSAHLCLCLQYHNHCGAPFFTAGFLFEYFLAEEPGNKLTLDHCPQDQGAGSQV